MNNLLAGLKSLNTGGILIVWFFFIGFYVCGLLFPNTWWSTHFISFVPSPLKWILLALAILSPFVFYLFEIKGRIIINRKNDKGKSSHFIIFALTVLMGFLFIQFPIAHDNYGEAYILKEYNNKTADELPQVVLDNFFTYSLSPWAGQNTVMSLVTFISYYGKINYQKAFVLLDLIFGVLFVLVWLYFVYSYLKNRKWKVVMVLAGLSAPFLLNFYGHIEINAPALFFNLSWLVLMLSYLKSKNAHALLGLLLLLIVCIKFHAVALLFVPAMVLVFLLHFFPGFMERSKLLSWQKIVIFILTPILIIGMFVYFFVFEDHLDTRQLQDTAMEYDRLFLPLVSPDPPLDNYNMLSFNHIFDYFSEMLLWSPVIFFLVVVVLFFYRKRINWNQPEIILIGVSLILFGALFFVVNPLLSMQMDWDLFSMPGPVFLVFGLVLISRIEKEKINPLLIGSCLSLVIMALPFFMVHASANPLSQRLESAGIRIFKTYYEWADQTIQFAFDIVEEDKATIRKRRQDVLNKLAPYAIAGKDYEYARILAREAEQVLRVDKDYAKALEICDKVSYYNPNHKNNILYQLEAHFLLNQMEMAYQLSLRLIALKHPNEEKARRIAIHTALEAELYDEALYQSTEYLKRGSDEIINEVYYRLQNNIKVNELKFLFTRDQ
ncbi:MAG: hypothetical protein R2750_02240 [Bacteroidales bacterium]